MDANRSGDKLRNKDASRLRIEGARGFWDEAVLGAIVAGVCYPIAVVIFRSFLFDAKVSVFPIGLFDVFVDPVLAVYFLFPFAFAYFTTVFVSIVVVQILQYVFHTIELQKPRLYMATLVGSLTGFISSLILVVPASLELGYATGFKLSALASVMCQIGATLRGGVALRESNKQASSRFKKSVPRFRIVHFAITMLCVATLLTYLKLSEVEMFDVVLFFGAWLLVQTITMAIILGLAKLFTLASV